MAFTSEDLFTAIKTIVDKTIEKVAYDKTIVCTIVDNSKASEGEYTVSDGSANFTAYSEKTNYTNGANVYVTIPQGNYENKKLIIGKYLGDDDTPYTYNPPTENYVNMTGNIIPSSGTYSLLANYENNSIINDIIKLTDLNLIGYNRLGIKADFQTLFKANSVIAGTYGLRLRLVGTPNDTTTTDNYISSSIYFSSDDMFGNPYNFVGPTTQEMVFDVSAFSEIDSISIDFYQNNDFKNSNNKSVDYKTKFDQSLLSDNLFVSDIEISAGYDFSQFDKETILLYTLNSKIFSSTDQDKHLQVRFVSLDSDTGIYSQKGDICYMADGDELVTPSGADTNYIIHWYQWDMVPEVKDDLAGVFWKEIYPLTCYDCLTELRGAAKAHERFKVIVEEVLGEVDGEDLRNYYESEVLEFTNENGSVETNLAVDLVSGLTLSTNDSYNGVYAIYTADGKLMNQAEALKDRYVVVSYQSLVTGLSEFDGAESIVWQIPGNNTMIIVPEEQGDNLTYAQDENTKLITVSGTIDSNAEDSETIGDNNIRGAQLRFRISPVYSQINTNNTIKCLITRQGFQYSAQLTMRFAPSGTNGTDYTLDLEIDSNSLFTAIPLDSDGSWTGLNVVAHLQDYENKPISGKISLQIEDDAGLTVTSPVAPGDIATITKTGETLTGYGKLLAKAYVWVSSNKSDNTEEDDTPTDRQVQLQAYLPLSYAAPGHYSDIIEGPVRVIYDGGGSNPVYTKLPYRLYNSNGEIKGISWTINGDDADARYIGKIDNAGLYIPPTMLVTGLKPVYIEGKIENEIIWKQRILLDINRFGSSMLNKWDGSLVIDEKENQILSSIIGAGSKGINNTFTGVLMGDIGKTMASSKTGLYGYKDGQQAFSFLVDGTATIGQAGQGALKFNGNDGTISAESYLKNEEGMLLDFDDAQLLTKLVKIRGQAPSSKSILEIDGYDLSNKDSEDSETEEPKPLMRIGHKNYFLQSANFDQDEFKGFKLDLAKNKIIGYDTTLNFYNTSEKYYLPSGKTARFNKLVNITVKYENQDSEQTQTKVYENCYCSEDLVLTNITEISGNDTPNTATFHCRMADNTYGNLEIFEGLQDRDWCLQDKALSVNSTESLLTIDSGAKQYPLWLSSNNNKTFKLGWDGSLQANSGMIGNWIINSNSLTTNGGKIGMAGWRNQYSPILWSGYNASSLQQSNDWQRQVGFGVSTEGGLYANWGAIGGWNIGKNILTGSKGYNSDSGGSYVYTIIDQLPNSPASGVYFYYYDNSYLPYPLNDTQKQSILEGKDDETKAAIQEAWKTIYKKEYITDTDIELNTNGRIKISNMTFQGSNINKSQIYIPPTYGLTTSSTTYYLWHLNTNDTYYLAEKGSGTPSGSITVTTYELTSSGGGWRNILSY